MKVLYTKTFRKDVERLRHDIQLKKRLLDLIEQMKLADSLTHLEGVRKIQGYEGYYRIRIGDYRLGFKLRENVIEMLRFLHRKDIYRRFP